jgi:hypothetical protein
MDRIAFAAICMLVLGLWLGPKLTGGSDPTARPLASASPLAVSSIPTAGDLAHRITELPDPSAMTGLRGKEGFWRLGRTEAGVWWLVSPQNKPDFLNSVTTVQPWQFGRDKEGINYISRDWNAKPGGDGDLDAWAQKTIDRIRKMGFKAIGAWSNPVFHKFDIPITRDLNISTWMQPSARRLYYPEWASTAEYAVQTQVVPLKDNKNLVGYFIDNELEWGDEGCGPSHYFDNLATEDPNRREVIKVIRTLWPAVGDFNRDWHAEIKDWNELDGWKTLPHEHSEAYSRLFTAWLSHLAEDYFKLTCGLIRKYDANHLILGVRFRGWAPKEVVRASRDYTDVQSLNYYVPDARLDPEMFRMMYEESGQPIMITEYSFHSLDGRSGNRNTVGFAAQVLDQKARADGYRLFTTRAARVPYLVGVDWFQWSDEPPSGRSSDGEDVNFGMVDVDDIAYPMLAEAVRSTSALLNPAHAASVSDPQTDVWRESFANKPSMRVPYLKRPVYLNGELSDWPDECKLQGVRHSLTVGLERSKLPLPNFYLGWRDEGLYIGFEVFDDDIIGAPANGWWWTRDFVEMWVSTRNPGKDQNAYDVNSHQFFFVPNSWPGADGLLGTVGQYHRSGDAQKDHLVPHPDIRDAVRVLPDRYVVEMMIPAKALHGFDPRHESTMAFNLHVRNFQHATDYFWSAPKENMTQLRPNTWGELHMVSPEGDIVQLSPNELSFPLYLR